VEVKPDGREVIHKEEHLEFEVGQPPCIPEKVKLKLQVRNRSVRPYYFSLNWYSREYGIYSVRNELIYPGEAYTTFFGESPKHHFVLPEQYDENTDVCQLIVSRETVDDFFDCAEAVRDGKIEFCAASSDWI
jgi:hypothetical protein